MNSTRIPPRAVGSGRSSTELSGRLLAEVKEGTFAPGSFMPPERDLSARYSVARMTARRALKALEAQGVLRAEPGKGYRVLSRGNDPAQGCPIGFALGSQDPDERWADLNLLLLKGLQQAAEKRGWPVLGVGASGQDPERILEQCLASRAWGLVLDLHRPELVRLAQRIGLPLVMVDAWETSLEVDVVFQNGFLGGTQAVDYLAERGHRRIAWYGELNGGVHSATRFGGAFTALRRRGLDLPADFQIDASRRDGAEQLGRLLARGRDRPTAVVALWQPCLRGAADVAGEVGLELGRDLELVGWTPVEQYQGAVAAHFRGGHVPAVVEWSIAEMAEMAIDRLACRHEHPGQPPVTINIQTRIRPAAGAGLCG